MTRKNILKAALLVLCASMFMGNTGCESDEARKRGRILKRSIDILDFKSPKIKTGEQIEIDIAEIIEGQMYTELEESGYFVPRNKWTEDNAGLAPNPTGGECTQDLPEAMLGGSITDFEMGNEYGAKIGFGDGGIFNGLITGADFVLKEMSMGLDMHAVQPLTWSVMTSTKARGTKRDFGGGVGLNLGFLNLNPSFMRREPIAEVVRKTFRKTIDDLGEQLEELEPWSARVYENQDSHVLISAGKKHGLKEGDSLYVSNIEYIWSGQKRPCKDPLRGQYPRQNEKNPLATLMITNVGLEMSRARVIDARVNEDIQEGAKVYIYYLEGLKDGSDPLPEAPQPKDWLL